MTANTKWDILKTMTEITERQLHILTHIVSSYIKTAEPVSSQYVEQRSRISVSPATIRNEMRELADQGLIFQPHTSAGRVPTERGYRMFVDHVLELEQKRASPLMANTAESRDTSFSEEGVQLFRSLAKFLSRETSNLVVLYTTEHRLFWQEGWGEVLREPEFRNQEYVADLIRCVKDMEECVENVLQDGEFSVYIGQENPFSSSHRLSVVMGTSLRYGREGLVAIVGPTRMAYTKNIRLIRSLL